MRAERKIAAAVSHASTSVGVRAAVRPLRVLSGGLRRHARRYTAGWRSNSLADLTPRSRAGAGEKSASASS